MSLCPLRVYPSWRYYENISRYIYMYQAIKGGKFAQLIGLRDDDMDIDTTITPYKTDLTDPASEILRKKNVHVTALDHQRCSRSLMRGEI